MRHRALVLALVVTGLTACAGHARREERREAVAASDPVRGPGERRDDRRDAAVEAETGWVKLGERVVDGRGDTDTIVVTAREGAFTRLKLVVEHSALELWDLKVVFGDGEDFSPGTRVVFGRGAESRALDLPGAARIIRRVTFRYGNLPGGGRAQLELWAR